MNQAEKGWTIFIAALGVMLSLIAVDIAKLSSWSGIYEPTFVSSTFVHISAVIAAFVGGKKIPTGGK